MKAMVLHQFGSPLKLQEVPIPEIGPREVLLAVKACGTGLTLTHLRSGRLGGSLPRIIGHEIGGIIQQIGSQVTGYQVGDRVTNSFYLVCGHCKFCFSGRETLCENFKGFVGSSIDGGYAEFVKLPVESLVRIPDGMGFAEAGVTADAIATPVHVAKERAKIKPLDDVLVIGAGGGVGVHMVQVAKAFGATVIAADVSNEKLEFAKKAGADVLINVAGTTLEKAVMDATGGKGVDSAIDFVSKKETLEDGIKSLKTAGKLIVVGTWTGNTIEINPGQVLLKELEITGSRYANKQEIAEALEMVRRGLVKPLITRTFKLEEVNQAHELIDSMQLLGRVALIME